MKVLIVGCERSGTSAISNLLSKTSRLSLLDDPRYSWYLYPLINVNKSFFSWKLIFDINRYDIVKVPGFATILPYLNKRSFQKFKIVYIVRDPRDNVSALKERLNLNFNGLLLNIEWLNAQPKTLVESLALRWKLYLDKALAFQEVYSDRIMFVRYEDFTEDKLATIFNLCQFLNLNFDAKLIQGSLNRQFRKSWSSKIKGKGRYINDLSKEETELIENICCQHMLNFNY